MLCLTSARPPALRANRPKDFREVITQPHRFAAARSFPGPSA